MRDFKQPKKLIKKNYLNIINNSNKPFIIYKTIKGFDLFTDFSKKITLNNKNIIKFLNQKHKLKTKYKDTDLLIGFFGYELLNNLITKPAQWFQSTEAKHKLSNILSFQDENGIWPKNINTADYKYDGLKSELQGTFDNSASLNELRLLAKAYNATKNNAYKKAFNKGLQCILKCQYPNGGWPQRPNAKGYSEHITFNDGTMIGIMTFLGEVHKDNDYKFATEKYRRICKERFDLGVQCIIKCQIRVNGKLTAWCAQHHK